MAKLRLQDDQMNQQPEDGFSLGGDQGGNNGGVFEGWTPEQFPLGDPNGPLPADLGNGFMGRGATSAREEGTSKLRQKSDANSMQAPDRPDQPTPMAGSSSITMPQPGPTPFDPMSMAPTSRLAKPGGGSLYGGAGGLQGGGLGVPFDPTTGAESDPISTLMMLLQQAGKA